VKLFQHGLIEARAAIAAGEFSAGEYLESCIARTLSVEHALNAFVYFNPQQVRRQLAAQQGRESTGPLAGMPIGIKDIIATAGIPTEMGSAAFKGHIPNTSAWVVARLEGAGSLMFGKTATTEFAWRQPAATRNPWKLGHTPGGSSSGSAAAVAAGCVPAALGTQTFGSVIRPAAYCGVVGYKPSFGATPRTGVYPLSPSLDHIGAFARSVGDAALLAAEITGADGIDFLDFAPPTPCWPVAVRASPPRIALVRTEIWNRTALQQQQAVEHTATLLESLGAEVHTLELPASFAQIWDVAKTICDAEGTLVNTHFADETPPRVSVPILELVARGQKISAGAYLKAKSSQQALIREFAKIMAPFDALLTAPALDVAPSGLENTGDAVFCIPFTLLGVPAITLPVSVSNAGLPLGIQLAGCRGDDRRLLEAALWIERALSKPIDFPEL
jgi:amidase